MSRRDPAMRVLGCLTVLGAAISWVAACGSSSTPSEGASSSGAEAGATGAPEDGGPSSTKDASVGDDASASADGGAGSLFADRTIDWSHAGVVQTDGTQGIPHPTTLCATLDATTYGKGSTDVSGALQAAIDACPAGQVVFIPAGTYLLARSVTVSSSIVIRGAGPATKITENGGTFVYGSQPSQLHQTNWTAGYTKGTTTITVDDTSQLHTGQILVLDQLNDTAVTTPGYVPIVNPTGNEGTVGIGVNDCASRDGLSFCTDGTTAVPRALMQFATVAAIAGDQVTLDRPVYYTHLASLSPQAFFWEEGNLAYAGIESLKIDAQYGDAAISFAFCSNCWAKALEVDHIARGAVTLYYADHFELRDSYLYMNQATAPTNYGVEIDDTCASRFENNIFDALDVGLLASWSSSGNVLSYNYSVNESPGGTDLGVDQGTHSVHAFMNLFEGNTAGKLGYDYVWGSSSHQTIFRNRLTGYLPPRPLGTGTWSNGNWPLFIEAWNRDFNVIGNVLGTAGVQNGYQATDVDAGALVGATGSTPTCQGSCALGVGPIFVVGYWNSWQSTGNTADFDPLTVSTLLRWGNYDYFTTKAHWDPSEIPSGETAPSTQTLPASLYLPGKPSWFGSAPFPPIGPDVADLASKLPAELCYEKENVGDGGTFDPTGCY